MKSEQGWEIQRNVFLRADIFNISEYADEDKDIEDA